MENKATSVEVHLNKKVSDHVAKNREKLKPIIEAIIMCERQLILLQGHCDDDTYAGDKSNNPGNLHAIRQLLAKCGNNFELEDHFNNASKNLPPIGRKKHKMN